MELTKLLKFLRSIPRKIFAFDKDCHQEKSHFKRLEIESVHNWKVEAAHLSKCFSATIGAVDADMQHSI